ncbi:MAG TPA: TIGR03960 family B12-binding radical SAM protein [Bacillota bacterium]|nr:TIGR03960 family B12-binding radical SAM protein [Bacillota bacterium]
MNSALNQLLEEEILPRVTKPSRYVGHEWNVITKDWNQAAIKMAFCFPDTYEVGMSHLGTRILYHIVNSREDVLMERVFAPWVDMEEQLRQHGVPLFSLENRKPLTDFDLLGFTLQYEMSFTNILNMLNLAGIPLYSEERAEEFPLVIAGGPCAFNPEPLAPFIDAFVIGEGEEVINQVLDTIKGWKLARQKEKQEEKQKEKQEEKQVGQEGKEGLLMQLAQIPGIYVPAFYDVEYTPEGKIREVRPNRLGVPATVTKRVVSDFDQVPFPTKPIVPYTEIVHDRIMLEVLRGCARGCRFCQAGMLYRPVREKRPETLCQQAKELMANTGYNDISLTSLSTSDYSCVGPVVDKLLEEFAGKGVGISLPSLRVDSFSVGLAEKVQKVRKTGLTLAPEAGTQRLRDVINKGVTEENLVEAVSAAFRQGWTTIKLYFMIGLPTETLEDVAGIATMAQRVVQTANELGVGKKGKQLKVTVSVSSFVPKAGTPFQWEPQDSLATLREKQEHLKNRIRNRKITYNYHDAKLSVIEGVFARGDRRVAAVLARAWQLGCKFDGWSDQFRFDLWQQAFAETGIDAESYAQRRFDHADVLPWEHIASGVSKEFLMREHEKAVSEQVTPDCRWSDCSGCRVCDDLQVGLDLKNGEAANAL